MTSQTIKLRISGASECTTTAATEVVRTSEIEIMTIIYSTG